MRQSSLDNPFRPRFGRAPPFMGRRKAVERDLGRVLGAIRGGESDVQAVLLYGPRGNGKTVLLNWLERQAEGEDGRRPVTAVRFSSRDIGSLDRMARAVRRHRNRASRLRAAVKDASFRLELPLLSVDVGGDQDAGAALEDWLYQGEHPLLLTVDEAHETEPGALGDLLNAVQIAGGARPIALVLAGTPGIMATLQAAGASFWSRCERLPIGLLSDDAAREVLAVPFRRAGLVADPEAVALLAEAADNYPYFLQLHGHAAWDLVSDRRLGELRVRHVQPALESAHNVRRHYYGDRYDEFDREGLLPVARRVALAFRASLDSRLHDMDLNRTLTEFESKPGRRARIKDFLVAKGYVWRDGADRDWTPGIPSLMDYMVEETEPPAETQLLR